MWAFMAILLTASGPFLAGFRTAITPAGICHICRRPVISNAIPHPLRGMSNPAQYCHCNEGYCWTQSHRSFYVRLLVRKLFGRARKEQRDVTMLWTIFVLLLILWLLGFSLHVGGGLIHLLLVVGLVVLVINLLSGRQTAV
jgi:hypothetical protein